MPALVNKAGKILDIKDSQFDVHPDLRWIDTPQDAEIGDTVSNGHAVKPEPAVAEKSQITAVLSLLDKKGIVTAKEISEELKAS